MYDALGRLVALHAAFIGFAGLAMTTAKQEGVSVTTYVLPDTPLAAFQNAKFAKSIDNDRGILFGGIGSDLWQGPSDAPTEFWMITDRGPNGLVEVDDESRRTFPVPAFNPTILHVRVADGAIEILESLPILTASGKPMTGLPNLDEHDEVPYDFSGRTTLPLDPSGLDTEGFARTSRGDFWLCDEYAPSLVHVDESGRIVERYVPEGREYAGSDYPVAAVLPAIFAKRKVNRGFEGLTLSVDEKTVYVVMQSPLSNPRKKVGNASRNTRILAFDIASKKPTAEYVYVLEEAKAFAGKGTEPEDMKLSGVVALNPTTLVVLERTDEVAKLYAVDLSKATNILGSKWDEVQQDPSLESLDDVRANAVEPVAKSLVIDLTRVSGCPDKIEGVAVVDAHTIAIANDSDFEVGDLDDDGSSDFDEHGNHRSTGNKSKLLVVTLSNPLPLAAK